MKLYAPRGRGPYRAQVAIALILGIGFGSAQAENGAPTDRSDLATSAERGFLDENAAAMDRMMAGMAVAPTGDVDRDFVAMMTPHHQGAIEMAQAYLRHGRNDQLRRLAQEIIVEQQQEIAAMNLAVGKPLPAPAPAPTAAGVSLPAAMPSTAPTGRAHHHSATSNR